MRDFGVVFRCDAGGEYGLGHAARCLVLAHALRAEGAEPVFIVQPGAPEGQAFIADRNIPVHVSPARAGRGGDVTFVAERLRRIRQPAVLALDSRDLDAEDVAIYDGAALTLCIDDERMRNLPCDVLLNNHPWADETSYGPMADRMLLLGPRYNLVEEVFFQLGGDRDPKRDVSRVLLTMGGEDPANHTIKIIEACAESLRPFDIDIVIGPSHPDPESVKRASARYLPSFALHHAPRGLANLIAHADVALSAGGTTCYELAAARVPTAAIPVEPHQVPLVDSLERSGVVLRLDNRGIINSEAISRLVRNASLREQMANAAAKLMPGPGARHVVRQVCDLLAARTRS